MPLNETIVESVGNANFKSLAEIGINNALSHQQRLQLLAEKSLSKSLEAMDNVSVPEGLGISAAQRGDSSKTIADLSGAIASIQQMLKGAQTTRPETGGA